jgi:hypothetical protein
VSFASPARRWTVRRVRRWPALVVVVCLCAALAACTGSDTAGEPAASPTETAPPVRTAVEQVWRAAGIDPVTGVTTIGGVAVVFGTTSEGLLIYGLDPATGSILWSKPAIVPGSDFIGVWAHDIDGSVAYYRPTGTDRVSQFVLADPKTGADRSVSAARYWSAEPASCQDDETWVCLASFVQSGTGDWDVQSFRINQGMGETAPVSEEATAAPAGARSLPVPGLYYTTDNPDLTTFGRWVDGATTWTKTATDLFGADLPKPNYFWTSMTKDRSHAIVTALKVDRDPGARVDLSTSVSTSTFSMVDGSPSWIRPGWSGCGLDRALARISKSDEYLCRYTGSAVPSTDRGWRSTYVTTDLDVTVERVDPATGDVRWSADVGGAKTLAGDSTGGASAVLDDTHVYEPSPAGGLVIDLDTGSTRASTADDTFWCDQDGTFTTAEPKYESSTPITTAEKSGLVRPCRSTGEDAPIPTTTIPAAVSATFPGDLRVVSMPGKVAGFLVPPSAAGVVDAAPDPSPSPAPSASPTASAVPAPQPVLQAVEQAWATTGFEARSTPVLVAGTAVLYGSVGTDLFLIGIDPATGAERWRRQVSVTEFSPDQEITVDKIDDKVAYLRPVADVNSQIVVIDPATGTDLLASEQQWWVRLPQICTDDSASLCAAAYVWSDDRSSANYHRFRIDRVTGATTMIPDDASTAPDATAGSAPTATPAYTTLWNDFVSIDGAPVETVGIVKDSAVVWSRPLTELLGPDATLNHGWYASEDDGDVGVLQLSGTVGWKSDGTNYPALDLATNVITVGINSSDGTVIWQAPGTSPQCRYQLPSRQDMSTPGSENPDLRCRYTGRLDSAPVGYAANLSTASDLSVTVERVDLQTGKAVWSVPVGTVPALAVNTGRAPVTLLDDHRLLANGQILDLDGGSVRPPAAGETFWCPESRTFTQTSGLTYADGSTRYDRRIEGEYFPCDQGGAPAAGSPTAVPLAVSTVTDSGLRMVATRSGVIAYRVPL